MNRTLFILLGVFWLHGCAPDISETDFFNEHPEAVDIGENYIEIGQENQNGYTFRLLAPEMLHAGHSTVWVEIRQDEHAVAAGDIQVTPIWTNEVRAVIPPFATVQASKMEETDRFEASPFFLEPSGHEGAWELHVDYDISGNVGTVVFNVDVREDIWVQHVEGSEDYYVSWVLPVRPTIGTDVIRFALHRLSDQGFIPVENAVIDLYPYMDMGAGEGHSTPFEAPEYSGEGMYTGQVNFIMSGGWDMTAFVQRPAAEQDTVIFKGFTVH